ncbi:hypothetical protein PIROE2DRAFT_7136 [Piromyces sp. E2]|nr:hypothetical protein PIROE2DRAFT_7136 [Piromyces sp. E2]|eukprot:OUM65807.1 hypothetical protein PIROE2DRAFT_7136 [Piromyces sp. E2]
MMNSRRQESRRDTRERDPRDSRDTRERDTKDPRESRESRESKELRERDPSQIPERGIVLNEIKDKKDEFVGLTPDKWCSDYQSWQQSVRKLAENYHNDFVSEADGYSRRWNRSMHKFFRLYDGTWKQEDFDSAKLELQNIIYLEDVDPVLKEVLSGHCRASVVDSKVPLTAYLKSLEVSDEIERKILLKEHAKPLHDHVTRESRESRERYPRDPRESRDTRKLRDSRERDPRDPRVSRDTRELRDSRERDPRDPRVSRDTRELRDSRERDPRDPRDLRDRDPRDPVQSMKNNYTRSERQIPMENPLPMDNSSLNPENSRM